MAFLLPALPDEDSRDLVASDERKRRMLGGDGDSIHGDRPVISKRRVSWRKHFGTEMSSDT